MCKFTYELLVSSLFRCALSRCDRYFWLPARGEHRGVGGIFFDDLEAADTRFDAEQVHALQHAVCLRARQCQVGSRQDGQ